MSKCISISGTAQRMVGTVALGALALALAACGKDEPPTVGQKLDAAVEKTEQAAAQTKSQVETAMQKAQDSTQAAANRLEDAAKQAGQGAAALVDDAAITAQVAAGLAKDPELSALKIDVDTKNGSVTLSGPAANAAARERAETIARHVQGVAKVHNLLTVMPS